ncbi:MAG: ECF-type sigma factor [Phycisphaerales bacterium]|jgi:RNA polymerase sigma factor (TIGR02999 family)|nr:ECF-type sigma factor [Phycisphaerales bacterium]
MSTTQRDITGFLNEASSGDSFAISKLWQEVQCDVHDMAENICRREYSGNTVQPTVLVNEVWIRLYGKDGVLLSWENRAHFFGSVARSMGQILVDYARKRNTQKRGGGKKSISIELIPGELASPETQVNAMIEPLLEAIEKLQKINARAADVVRFRYLLGLTQTVVADLLQITDRTVRADWIWARAWLRRELSNDT